MTPTWHRVSTGLWTDSNPGTVSVFIDYDLLHWSFGFRVEVDPSWLSLYLDLGPITISPTYWRFYPTDTGRVT